MARFTRVFALAVASSALVAGGGPMGTASFHVGAMSCTSCEKSIRGNLAKFEAVEVLLASAEKKRVELRFDTSKVSMQEILKTIAGKAGHYEARLALQYVNPKVAPAQAEKTRMALMKVPGVRAAGLPDDEGVILLTFRESPAALLPAILRAAEAAGTPMRDPESPTSG